MNVIAGNAHGVTEGFECPGITGAGGLASHQGSKCGICSLSLIPVNIAYMVYQIV